MKNKFLILSVFLPMLFIVAAAYPARAAAPELIETIPVTEYSDVSDPEYGFGSTQAGSITYAGGCSSDTVDAVVGQNVIIFNSLADGYYPSCAISVTNSTGETSLLQVTPFTIDTVVPVVTVNSLTTDIPSPQLTGTVDDPQAELSLSAYAVPSAAQVAYAMPVNNGDGTWSLPAGSFFNLNPGVYDIFVQATDFAGNMGNDYTFHELTITSANDTTPPVITIIGLPFISIQQGDAYIDAGATAMDNVDGDVTANIATTNNVDTAVSGVYSVNYSVSDAAGNTASASRTVDVFDDTAPVVTVNSLTTDIPSPQLTGTVDDPQASIDIAIYNQSLVMIFAGVAVNNGDGTWTLPAGSIAPPLSAGTYDVDVTATDFAGNVAYDQTLNELVIVAAPDTLSPVITILGNNPEIVLQGDAYIDAGATAMDNVDGDVTANIATTNNVDTAVIGVYSVNYSVSDAAGNTASAARMVDVVEVPPPVDDIAPVVSVNVLTTAAVSPELTGTVDDPLASIGIVIYDGSLTTVFSGAAVNNGDGTWTLSAGAISPPLVIGVYDVEATATDPFGNSGFDSAYWELTIESLPVDTTPPVITILGNNPEIVLQGDAYIDAGATAMDNVDGDVTADIIVTDNVNTSIIGTYTVDYSVSDTAGNVASVSRTVNVIEPVNQPPVATNDTFSFKAGERISLIPSQLLANDSDPEGGALTLISVSSAVGGRVSFRRDVITFTPDRRFTGQRSFDYTIQDLEGLGAMATVFVNIVTNQPPVAVDDEITAPAGITTSVPVTDLMANDSDPNSDELSFSRASSRDRNLRVRFDRRTDSILVTPRAGFSGTASFTYTISDSSRASAEATVMVNVTP